LKGPVKSCQLAGDPCRHASRVGLGCGNLGVDGASKKQDPGRIRAGSSQDPGRIRMVISRILVFVSENHCVYDLYGCVEPRPTGSFIKLRMVSTHTNGLLLTQTDCSEFENFTIAAVLEFYHRRCSRIFVGMGGVGKS